MFQIIQYDLSGNSKEHLVKQVMSGRIAQCLIRLWNQSAEQYGAAVQYYANYVG
jgi:hypothetical protein